MKKIVICFMLVACNAGGSIGTDYTLPDCDTIITTTPDTADGEVIPDAGEEASE